MAVISGVLGAVNTIPCIRQWEGTVSDEIQEVVCSSSDGMKQRIPGNQDWSGKFTQYATGPIVMPGDSLGFIGSIEGAVGIAGTVIVDQIDVNVDVEAGGVISLETSFSGNGSVTVGAAVAADVTLNIPEGAVGTKIELAIDLTTPIFVAIDDIRTYTLSFTSENGSYVSSSTAGGVRRIAGNKDATGSFTQYASDFADMMQIGDVAILRFFINATEFWELKFVRVVYLSNLQVDRESAALIGGTVNFAFSGVELVSASPAKGTIIKPDTNAWWP